ncbi:MAG TPA: potassium transporter Kef [Clostridium sp.]|jgi:Kef-type K+ transport system membrane component KefB|uniref:cation:proton antiporter n=1 Tax=uncultured Clostridium sp. TaxID=59620 RepID=UPI000E7FB7E2|nr:cation:proton antiporter [uncultured Clostridium sp.]NLU08664.1 cation:proton antiporter [Clostridiales bacterium]HBC96419.1 potassium transporter Kef [Clostridium sp.]
MWLLFSKWIVLSIIAGIIAYYSGISISLVEILVGIAAGNVMNLTTNQWIDFLAGAGSIILTFQAGAEIDHDILKSNLKQSLFIGILSFAAPFVLCFLGSYYILGWTLNSSEICGIALSTTSVAVVYSVMLETGLDKKELGQKILAACFVTDLGTVLALGLIFANFNKWLLFFIVLMIAITPFLDKITTKFNDKFGGKTYQLEVKYIFLILFLCGGIATMANVEAVLPAYIIGLALSPFFKKQKYLNDKLTAITFSLFIPFYFLKAGSNVSYHVINYAWIVLAFLAVKIITKYVGIRPLTVLYGYKRKDGIYTTLLMATGLTFGSISALFGLNHGFINKIQYSIIVTTVILSAVVPTLIAQKFFNPLISEDMMDAGNQKTKNEEVE